MISFWVIFTLFLYHSFHKIRRFMLILDSIWLVTFAFIWSSIAYELNLWFFWIIFFSVISSVWGWVLRDVVLNKTPMVFETDLYATLALFLWIFYWIFSYNMDNIFWSSILLLTFFIIRLSVIYFKINLWKPNFLKN